MGSRSMRYLWFKIFVAAAIALAGGRASAALRCTVVADGAMIHPKLVRALLEELKSRGFVASERSELAPVKSGAPTTAPAAAASQPASPADLLLVVTDIEGSPLPQVELVVIDPARGARLGLTRIPADRPTVEIARSFAKVTADARDRVGGGVKQVFSIPF